MKPDRTFDHAFAAIFGLIPRTVGEADNELMPGRDDLDEEQEHLSQIDVAMHAGQLPPELHREARELFKEAPRPLNPVNQMDEE